MPPAHTRSINQGSSHSTAPPSCYYRLLHSTTFTLLHARTGGWAWLDLGPLAVTPDPPPTNLTLQAQSDARMAGLYHLYLQGLVNANLTLANHFSSVVAWGASGFWGLMQWMDQDPATAPKLQVGCWCAAAHSQPRSCRLGGS